MKLKVVKAKHVTPTYKAEHGTMLQQAKGQFFKPLEAQPVKNIYHAESK